MTQKEVMAYDPGDSQRSLRITLTEVEETKPSRRVYLSLYDGHGHEGMMLTEFEAKKLMIALGSWIVSV